MSGLNLVHGLVVVLPFVLLVESDILKSLSKRAMSHQFLQSEQSYAGLDQLRGEGVPQRVGGVSQVGQSSLLEEEFHPLLDGACGDRLFSNAAVWGGEQPGYALLSHGKPDFQCRFDIGGHIPHTIHSSLAIVDAEGVMLEVECIETKSSNFSYSQSAAQHQQEHHPLVGSGDVREECLDMPGSHGFWQQAWRDQPMSATLYGVFGKVILIAQEGEGFGQQREIVVDGSGGEPLVLARCHIAVDVLGGNLSQSDWFAFRLGFEEAFQCSETSQDRLLCVSSSLEVASVGLYKGNVLRMEPRPVCQVIQGSEHHPSLWLHDLYEASMNSLPEKGERCSFLCWMVVDQRPVTNAQCSSFVVRRAKKNKSISEVP